MCSTMQFEISLVGPPNRAARVRRDIRSIHDDRSTCIGERTPSGGERERGQHLCRVRFHTAELMYARHKTPL